MLSHAVTLLTIASILGHALLGCCGHHVHAQDCVGHDLRASSHQHTNEVEAVGHEHGHEHEIVAAPAEVPQLLVLHSHWGSSPLADGSHGHDDDSCGEPPCSYVMPDGSRLVDAGDLPATSSPPNFVPWTPAEALLFKNRTALQNSPDDLHRDSARRRSLVGVWLL